MPAEAPRAMNAPNQGRSSARVSRARLALGLALAATLLAHRLAHASVEPPSAPLRFRDGLIWIDVRADTHARPLQFLVDSGASISVLDRQTARDLDLALHPEVQVAGVGATALGHGPVHFPTSVGPIPIRLPDRLLVLDLHRLSQACGNTVHGLIGADFFRDRIVELDYERGALRLLTSPPAAGAAVAVVPLRAGPRGLRIEAGLNDGPVQRLRVDTGCASALHWVSPTTHRPHLARVTATSLSRRSSIPQTLATLRLGNRHWETVPTGLHTQPIFPGEAGLLGNGLLAMFGTVTFDTITGHLHLGTAGRTPPGLRARTNPDSPQQPSQLQARYR